VNGYPGFGAAPKMVINFGDAFTACMRQEIASKKAGGAYNPSRCTSLVGKSAGAGGVPLTYYIAGAALLVGGSAWYFFFRKPKAS
jgi:hypothetical protein